jgi:RimJ/RimL family protein N-acetyltransferase
MAKKKKKQNGHYCRICGDYKANEKFSGKGHARHICKECQSLPEDVKADMVRCNEVERAAFKYPMTRQDWELLEKYALKYKDKESGRFAQDMLDMKRDNHAPDEDLEENAPFGGTCEEETVPFAELEDGIRYQLEELLADNINEFMIHKDYIPEGKELKSINEWVLKETRDTFFIKVIPDTAYDSLVEETINSLVKEWEEDGFEIKTYSASLVVMETERLLIRKITRKDIDALLAIMGKPEVMYAWEHGFTKKDVRKWINRQLTRYRKDGFGYFAVILKENGTLIGQAGLMKSTINGNEAVELGYILDNVYWHNGYGTEAARACLEYAFGELAQKTICCSIRPENGASIRVAERLGMTLCGSHTVIYNEKEMPHLIYELKTEN